METLLSPPHPFPCHFIVLNVSDRSGGTLFTWDGYPGLRDQIEARTKGEGEFWFSPVACILSSVL